MSSVQNFDGPLKGFPVRTFGAELVYKVMANTVSTASTRREFMKQSAAGAAAAIGALSVSGCSAPDPASAPARPPNIIFLLTDDQRWDMMGCAGNPIIQTPNMDKLAGQGVLFRRNFVTTSICAVSRASFFTGLYARCHGIHGFATSLSEEQHARSYPGMLREAGYRTGFIGKYGVGRDMPHDRFDYSKGFAGQGRFLDKDDPTSRPHLTTIMGDQAQEFLEDSTGGQPFCLSVSFKAPHVQDGEAPYFISDPAYDDLYADVTIPPFHKNDSAYYDQLPGFLKDEYEGRIRWDRRFSTPEKYQESVKRYYQLIYGVDVQIGRMLETLQRKGWDENTVIIFTGDNGFYLGERGLASKWLMHEESIRTPLIIRDPREKGTAGTTRDEMALNIDCAPTILSLAGIDAPASMNGRDLRPLVPGESPAWRHEWFYEHLFEHSTIPKTEGVRDERWKYCNSTYPLHSSCPDGEIALIYQLLVGQQMPIGCLGAVCFIANLSAKSTESPGISRQINRYQCGLTTRHVGAHY